MIALAPEQSDNQYDTLRVGNKPPKQRVDLGAVYDEWQKNQNPSRVNARYDAAATTDEFKNYWANADALDADSANSINVRHTLIKRSRYEVANNGYAAGIAQTYANDLVGLGPNLRMQTQSESFNRMVEREFAAWSKAVHLRRKLWTMAHAKFVDGEAFGVVRQNRNVAHRVKLDLVLHEAEQVQTPYLPYLDEGYIDGIKFDEFGNPVWYDLLQEHPWSTRSTRIDLVPEQVPARFVLHWFKMTRPGQHRGVPECASTLNLGAAGRRWREAVVAAAENIADFSLFIRTSFQPDEMDAVDPMSTLEIQKRMMTALPAGYEAFQPRAEQPTANHEMFAKSLLNEQARPANMPYNKAACDSSSYNFASGRLDHSTYYGSLDVDRRDCDDVALDKLFQVWFERAILEFGWLGGNPDAVSNSANAHTWDWPKHHVADEKSAAAANETRLRTGEGSLPEVYSQAGKDYEDSVLMRATAAGITEDQQRKIDLLRNVPAHAIGQVAAVLGMGIQPQGQHTPEQSEDEDAQA